MANDIMDKNKEGMQHINCFSVSISILLMKSGILMAAALSVLSQPVCLPLIVFINSDMECGLFEQKEIKYEDEH